MNTQELKELSNRIATIETKLGIVSKPKLEVGKWYKGTVDFESLIFITKIENIDSYNSYNKIHGYGFISSEWNYLNHLFSNTEHEESLIKATPQEVEEALVNEAKRRGYKSGVTCVFGDVKEKRIISSDLIQYTSWSSPDGLDKGVLIGNDIVFTERTGEWAEIIEQPVDKFAELKEAHRNGAVIQYKNWLSKYFLDCPDNLPMWDETTEYRIKPEEKPKEWVRLGRKQSRVILDNNNHSHEICLFHEKYKHLAPLVVGFLNKQKTTLAEDIQELKDKHPNLRFTITVEDNV